MKRALMQRAYVYLTDEHMATIRTLAHAHNLNFSAMLRRLLDEVLERRPPQRADPRQDGPAKIVLDNPLTRSTITP